MPCTLRRRERRVVVNNSDRGRRLVGGQADHFLSVEGIDLRCSWYRDAIRDDMLESFLAAAPSPALATP